MTTTDTSTSVGTGLLPAPFADLERFSQWILETENERYDLRLESSMADMQAFYDAAFARLQNAMAYMDQYPIDDLPEDVTRLLNLFLSLVEVSYPIERWRQARVPDSGASSVECITQPTL